jgi:hypothetical protein
MYKLLQHRAFYKSRICQTATFAKITSFSLKKEPCVTHLIDVTEEGGEAQAH